MINYKPNIFSIEQLNKIKSLPEVSSAYAETSVRNSVYFTIPLTNEIRQTLLEAFQLNLPDMLTTIPCRWIKGDTPPHIDRGQRSFENTYLVYLTDGEGEFHIDNQSYGIEAGTGFSFSEGLSHEVINTNGTTRLLLGPMSEQGFAVGSGFNYPGGTIVYIRQSGSDIQSSLDQVTWTTLSFSVTVTNSNTSLGYLKIYFTTDITITTNAGYFTCNSDYIQFGNENLNANGTRPTITISVDNYDGFIFNGDSDFNGKNNIRVYNLIIDGTGKTTQVGGGWLGHQYFGKGASNNYIINCSSKGSIAGYGGGILARFAGTSGGSVTVIGCSSTGSIADAAGGIVGAGCENVTCDQCFSTGTINQNSGGIFAQETVGTCSATKCYSTGSIGLGAGGIVGASAADGVTVSKCYSTGSIGTSAGGIFGNYAATTTATNCYSTGSIGTSAGGIFGNPFGNPGTRTATNCYSADGTWSTSTANTNLTGVPSSTPGVGSTWSATASNTAYELANFGTTPYQRQTISGNALVQSKSQTIEAGQSGSAGLATSTYTILQKTGGDSDSYSTITINAQTGKISTSSQTSVGTYTLYIRSTGSYNITTFLLTVTANVVTANVSLTDSLATCCSSTINERGLTYQQINELKIGNRLLVEYSQNTTMKFNDYSEYLKLKMAQASRKN